VLYGRRNRKTIGCIRNVPKQKNNSKDFDSHINISMEDTELRSDDKKIKLGKVLIRGDSIVYISPGE